MNKEGLIGSIPLCVSTDAAHTHTHTHNGIHTHTMEYTHTQWNTHTHTDTLNHIKGQALSLTEERFLI